MKRLRRGGLSPQWVCVFLSPHAHPLSVLNTLNKLHATFLQVLTLFTFFHTYFFNFRNNSSTLSFYLWIELHLCSFITVGPWSLLSNTLVLILFQQQMFCSTFSPNSLNLQNHTPTIGDALLFSLLPKIFLLLCVSTKVELVLAKGQVTVPWHLHFYSLSCIFDISDLNFIAHPFASGIKNRFRTNNLNLHDLL